MHVIARDMNARIGAKLDSIIDIDDTKPRDKIDNNVIDKSINKHGKKIINFLLETRFEIINGRTTPSNNNFTSVSVKGKAAVDYIVIPLKCMKYIEILFLDVFIMMSFQFKRNRQKEK